MVYHPIFQCLLLCILLTARSLNAGEFTRAQLDFFESNIRPLLIKHCIACHGPQRQEADLRLDSRESILSGGIRGPAADLGNPSVSLLLKAVRHEDDLAMPPDTKLSTSEVNAIARWLRTGLAWPKTFELPVNLDPSKHWSFQPVRNPSPPTVPDGIFPLTEIDRFIVNKLSAHQLKLNSIASRHVLVRRVYQDLTGLPPTIAQIDAFTEDAADNAYETLLERVLEDPQFGPHWARMWMDVARYADNKGYIFYLNREFKWSYTYRDYLIEAFNEDRSFRQMVLEQLAADQLELNDNKRPLRAMGFVTLGDYFVNNKYDMIDDRIDVITRGLLGLTVTCARCHDHKFDPIPTADYYSLYGVLDSSHDPIVPPLFEDPDNTDEYQAFHAELQLKKATLDNFVTTTIGNLREDGRTRISDYLVAAYNQRNNPDSDNFMLLTDKGALNPRMIRRWINFLKEQATEKSSPWYVWNSFAALTDEEFETNRTVVYQSLKHEEAPLNRIIVRFTLQSEPASMQELATRYQEALLHVKDQIATDESSVCENQDSLDIKAALYGPTAPAEIPGNVGFDFLDLFPDRATQAEFKKILEDVEGFIRNDKSAPPRALVLLDNEQPTEPYIFTRGNPNNRGDYVSRHFLSVLDPKQTPFSIGSGRLELAQKIASPTNPLTARVYVNRLWTQLFGRGLVATPSDFGLRGSRPSHPDLLDHLATKFIESGWSTKSILKQIMMSETYRQSSDFTGDTPSVDPENILLWRANRKRMSWEQTRDALLQVTGELDHSNQGAGFDLNQTWIPRRSVFSYINRLDIPTLLRTFDYPSPNASIGQRSVTTVPQQGLWFFNNPFINQVIDRVNKRIVSMNLKSEEERIVFLYHICFARAPSSDELQLILEFLNDSEHSHDFRDLIHVLLMSNEFVFIN
tara:strand:- start:235 stop:2976 length:2742 start_codon:yes stop_codon:yes gene_type:complete